MSSNGIIKIGFDPGFGWIKAVVVIGSKVKSFTMPSVVGVGGDLEAGLDMAGLASVEAVEKPHTVAWDGLEYLAGQNVDQYCRPIARQDFARFIDGPELLALTFVTLAHLGVSGSQVALAIGLPVEILQHPTLKGQFIQILESRLCGQHSVTVNGKLVSFEIVKIRADVAQPLGAWLDWGLSNEGKWVQGPEGRTAPHLVIDQGFNTIDIFAVEEGRPSSRYTAGDTLGMRRASEMIAAAVRRKYGRQLGLHEADLLVQDYLNGEEPAIYVQGQPAIITPIVRQSLDALAAQVSQFLESILDDPGKFHILLTGGGALALGSRLQRAYPHAQIAPQPSLANARGLAKLALTSFLD